jgi:hypothetical protein
MERTQFILTFLPGTEYYLLSFHFNDDKDIFIDNDTADNRHGSPTLGTLVPLYHRVILSQATAFYEIQSTRCSFIRKNCFAEFLSFLHYKTFNKTTESTESSFLATNTGTRRSTRGMDASA